MMRMRQKRLLLTLAVIAVVGAVILVWPAATWLQGRELWADPAADIDALYLVAGARDQNRRIFGVVQFCKAREVLGRGPPAVLLGNDQEVRYDIPGFFEGRRLVDLAHVKIPALLGAVLDRGAAPALETVPGVFYGTDGEMAALAEYVRAHPELKRIVITTSPYHVRRVVLRFKTHDTGDAEVRVARIPQRWGDRNPILVLAELMKIIRDALGLSDAPLISRRWWVERGE